MLNAIAALEYVHGNYLLPTGADETGSLPYGYTDATLTQAMQDPDNIRTYQDATFVLIPQQGTLPIMRPIVDLAAATGTTPLVMHFVDLISPTLKVLIDLGYDRTANPGIPRTLSLLPFDPFQNWVEVGVNLAAAVDEGVQALVNDVSRTTTIAPTTPAPTSEPSTMSTLAAGQSDGPSVSATTDLAHVTTTTDIREARGDIDKGTAAVDTDTSQPAADGQPAQPDATATPPDRPQSKPDRPEAKPERPRWKPGNLFVPHITSARASGSEANQEQPGTDSATTTAPATGDESSGAGATTGGSQAAAA
jgi:PE-PPE domain